MNIEPNSGIIPILGFIVILDKNEMEYKTNSAYRFARFQFIG